MKNRNLRSLRRTKPAVRVALSETFCEQELRRCRTEARLASVEFEQAMSNIYALANQWRTQAGSDHPAVNGVLLDCARQIEQEVQGLRHAQTSRLLGLVEDDES